MKGFVGLTDYEWFTFLRDSPAPAEVNFWRPRGRSLLNAPEGMPFFFKLDAEHGSWIAGFGYFAWRSRLPAWLAWETFGPANGAPDRNEFLRLLARRRKEPLDPTGSFTIGCQFLTDPAFFPEQHWIRPPSDWSRSGIQTGKYYPDLNQGEGKRIYEECLDRARLLNRSTPGENIPSSLPTQQASERYGEYLAKTRKGQRVFQIKVLDAYGRSCAVTTEHSLPVLDAAHIRPYSEGGEHTIQNGILLRADIHRLYDKGLVTITPDHKFLVSRRLKVDYKNGRAYYDLQARLEKQGQIHLPENRKHYPDQDLLRWHLRERFTA